MWNSKNEHGEKFVKGCWSRSIKENGPGSSSNYQIKFRDRHRQACSLFEVTEEDSNGLHFRTKPLDPVQWADDLLVQLRSGTINNFSNGFRFIWDKVEYDDKDDALVVIEARLFEISAVEVPSDMETYAIREFGDIDRLELNEEIEGFIADLSKSKQLEARQLISKCMMVRSQEPLDRKALAGMNQSKKIDYNYLIKNL
jgi:HK97 family phage prohead protease